MNDERDEIRLDEPADRPRGTMVDDLAPTRELRRPGHVLLALSAVVVAGATALAVWWFASGSFERAGAGSVARAEPSDTGRPVAPVAARERERVYAPTGAIVPGVVYVESIPEGAEVRVNGELLGMTPLAASHALEGEKAEVELRKAGYSTWHGTAAVRSGGLRLEIGLEKR